MNLSLPPDHVLLNRTFASKQEVIRAIGEVMVGCGEVTPRYVRGMLEKEDQYSTWITDGVALPHGTNEVKSEVLRNSVVVVQIPNGVDWGGGKTVHVAIGLAGRGDDQHLKVLAALAGVLQDRANVERLRSSESEEEVIRILTAERGRQHAMKAAVLYGRTICAWKSGRRPPSRRGRDAARGGGLRHLRQRRPDLPFRRRQHHRAGDHGARGRGHDRRSRRRGARVTSAGRGLPWPRRYRAANAPIAGAASRPCATTCARSATSSTAGSPNTWWCRGPAIRAGCVNAIPENLSFEEATLAEPLACAINGQELLGVGLDDTVAIVGAGPARLHARAIWRRSAARARSSWSTCSRTGWNWRRTFGADVLIDAREGGRPRSGCSRRPDGAGASVVIVAAPSGKAQEQSLTLAAKQGRVSFFGGLPKTSPCITFNSNLIHYRELFVMGAYGSKPQPQPGGAGAAGRGPHSRGRAWWACWCRWSGSSRASRRWRRERC